MTENKKTLRKKSVTNSENSENSKNIKGIILIQSYCRKYLTRKKNRELVDGMTFSLLNDCIDSYITTINNEKKINMSLKSKKIRLSNFPSHISENIVKFAICKKYGFMPNWNTKKGDLVIDKLPKHIRCEVKGSIDLSNGPPSFGPKEEWDHIYFVDAVNNHKKKYIVYEIKAPNKSDIWKNIKISKTETYFDQCNQKRRPRINFSELLLQLGNHCKIIFDGYLSELDNCI